MRSFDDVANIGKTPVQREDALDAALKRLNDRPVLIHREPTPGIGQQIEKWDRLQAAGLTP
ncbi:MAG: hypothetical protein WC989_00315 [Micavibrio sp.]